MNFQAIRDSMINLDSASATIHQECYQITSACVAESAPEVREHIANLLKAQQNLTRLLAQLIHVAR